MIELCNAFIESQPIDPMQPIMGKTVCQSRSAGEL